MYCITVYYFNDLLFCNYFVISVSDIEKPFTFAPRFQGAVLANGGRRSLSYLRRNKGLELVLKKAKFIIVV